MKRTKMFSQPPPKTAPRKLTTSTAIQTSTWVIFGLLVAVVSSIHDIHTQQTPTNNNDDDKQNKQIVDNILQKTMLLLDELDQKLANVQNKTPNALMRDNLRALETDDAQPRYSDPDSSPVTMASSPNGESVKDKQARQLLDHTQSASDSVERHIQFTLDLMQAVFASHSSSAQSSGQSSSSSSTPKATNSIDSFLISPLSVQMVLMMMHLGARGQTQRELGNCLHLAPEEPEAPSSSSPPPPPGSTSSSKLKRRNQAENNKPPTSRQPPRHKRHSSDASELWFISAGPHAIFGRAVRNLLRDPAVLKALTSSNQLFLQKNLALHHKYETSIKKHYEANVKMVDFQQHSSSSTNSSSSGASENKQPDAQQIINDWIERQSRGKISNFLSSPVPASTLLMAINVVYFKGDWLYKFDPADTEPDAWFTQTNGRQLKVPMMVNRLPLAFAHDAAMRTSAIELPYKAQRLGLFLLLPDEISGIFHTMKMLNSTSFAHLISSMRRPTPQQNQQHQHQQQQHQHQNQASASPDQTAGINIRLPKFSIESSPRLSQILSQQLGLKTLFSPDVADLSGMFAAAASKRAGSSNRTHDDNDDDAAAAEPSVPPQVGLDELVHKAVLQVDEQGSVAAASSATIVERVGMFNGNYFEADHPFLIFLMDKQTGLVLFSGVFAGPNTDAAPSCKRGQQCS